MDVSIADRERTAAPHLRLFREQAIAAHARRLEGDVLIVQPASLHVVLCILSAFTVAALVFLTTASYARSERVTGYLIPSGGVSSILPVRAGVVSEVLVRAGDHVRAGDILVTVASRSALADGTELAAGLERALRRQAEMLRNKLRLVATTAAVSEQKLRQDLMHMEARQAHFQQLEGLARQRLGLAQRRANAVAALLEKGIVSEKEQQDQADRVLGLEAELRHAQDAGLAQA